MDSRIRRLLIDRNFTELRDQFTSQDILRVVRGDTVRYQTFEYLNFVSKLPGAQKEASDIAIGMMGKARNLRLSPSERNIAYSILSMFLEPTMSAALLQHLREDTPLPVAYRLPEKDITLNTYKFAPSLVLSHYILRDRVMPTVSQLAAILERPISLFREKIYYNALAKMIHSSANKNMSELEFLQTNSHIPVFRRRYDAIKYLFPEENVRFTNSGCSNDAGFTADIDEIPPQLLYKDTEGNNTYCFSSGDLFSIINNKIKRHPYLGSTLTAIKKKQYERFLLEAMHRGYPVMFSTASDFYDPVFYNSDTYDFTKRSLALSSAVSFIPNLYIREINDVSKELNIHPFALAQLGPLIRRYSSNRGWFDAFKSAYPRIVA